MYFYHSCEDPTTTNTWEANVDSQCVEDEDGVFANCRSTNQHLKRDFMQEKQAVTDQHCWTETATTAQNGSLLGNMKKNRQTKEESRTIRARTQRHFKIINCFHVLISSQK